MEEVAVIGAGLVGCLAALALKDKGFSVSLFEMRPNPESVSSSIGKRSINLALSSRGIRALNKVSEEIANKVSRQSIPMYGRMIHDKKGGEESQLYGLFGEANLSIDRTSFNELLLEEVMNAGINIYFDSKLIRIENLESKPRLTFSNSKGVFENYKMFEFDKIIGADGAHSQCRYQIQRNSRMDFGQKYIDMQYIELLFPAKENEEGKFAISPGHLHIWPRKDFMLIALPNIDGSFTGTFFSSWSMIESFKSSDEFIAFFKSEFPDAAELIEERRLREVFDLNPRGSLKQIEMYPYHDPWGKTLIIGDAAHSMVPFYGQGMNCGFEDVRVLMDLIEEKNGDISESFRTYSSQRHEDLKAISRLALDNYYEMSTKVISPSYLLRKKIDSLLGKYANTYLFQWIPLYSMVSFRDDISYSKAMQIEKRQALILKLIQNGAILTVGVFSTLKIIQFWNHFSRS